jgi:hypothetical protein
MAARHALDLDEIAVAKVLNASDVEWLHGLRTSLTLAPDVR